MRPLVHHFFFLLPSPPCDATAGARYLNLTSYTVAAYMKLGGVLGLSLGGVMSGIIFIVTLGV